MRWDLIVVGGGIVGCSAALDAARRGMRVVLLERDMPGSAQSGRNLGFVRQQNRDFRELDLMIRARSLWEHMEANLGRSVGWKQGGNLALAFSEAQLEALRSWQQRGAAEFGLDTRMLSAREARALVPQLEGNFAGAMYTASDGRAEPPRVMRALLDAAIDAGVDTSFGEEAGEIVLAAGRVAGVRVGDRLLSADVVAVAAGAGSAALLRKAGLDLPQERIRATVARTAPRPDLALAPCVSGQETGIRQDIHGAFILSVAGGEYDVRPDSWRHMHIYRQTMKSNPDAAKINYLAPLQQVLPRRGGAPLADFPPSRDRPRPEARRVEQARQEFARLFPMAADLPVATCWAGIIDVLPDVIPAIGAVDRIPGLIVATGFSGHGFGPGPMAGRVIAELAAGRPSPADISALSPMRFG